MKTNKLTIDGNKVMIENINYIDVSYKDGSIEFNTGVKADVSTYWRLGVRNHSTIK